MGEAEYILYVGHDARNPTVFCPGSRQALSLIDENDLQDVVTVQSVERLRENLTLPSWLSGTPTLVIRSKRQALRGSSAVDHLRTMGAKEESSGDAWGMVAPGEAMHLGSERNFEPTQEDSSKYTSESKVTEGDLQAFIARRQATVT